MDDDFEITPAMRAYLQAFDQWLRSPTDKAYKRRQDALTGLLAAPRVRSCRSGRHLMTPDNTYPSRPQCKACNREREKKRPKRNWSTSSRDGSVRDICYRAVHD